MNTLLLMMGGKGTRFGADIPKQYIEVNGKPIFSYILKAYNDMKCIDNIVIVSHADWIRFVKDWCKKLGAHKVRDVVAGGDTRSGSVKNGLIYCETFSQEDDVILIHDATHPYADEYGTEQAVEATRQYGGATLASFNYDVVYRVNEEGLVCEDIPRKQIVAGASPECFTFKRIHDIYVNATPEELEAMTSAGAIALAYGIPIKVIELEPINLKITFPSNMDLFIKLADSYFFKED